MKPFIPVCPFEAVQWKSCHRLIDLKDFKHLFHSLKAKSIQNKKELKLSALQA